MARSINNSAVEAKCQALERVDYDALEVNRYCVAEEDLAMLEKTIQAADAVFG